ncbi:site-2 protease family protein [Tunturiibacter gelidoferens]|uniref:Site-2 protease family protein n=2 Tax=Tunturiibacter gelidiferens TaxID=3069689 RepID=A0AAU7Z450_9BACT|nr:site-2 protease family protein [Edaphobacter lichenicola]MBB5340284.1 Zn-dependent protease [Edaphobacter lichenicola]
MTLACPECHSIVYARHLKGLGQLAVSQEQERAWPQARETWQQMLQWLPAGTEQSQMVAGHLAAIDGRIEQGEQRTATWKKRLGPLAPAAFFLMKAKTFLFALLKFKFLFSFFAFFGVYWALFGWRFGLGFAVSILIHELGHYVAARRRGLKADLPVFLPGFGAYVRWYSMGISLDALSSIALAGPFAGLLAAAACAAMYFFTKVELWAALAHAGAWLNLINLVPVLGLDGAQATHALNRMQRGLILAAAILFFAFLHEGVFLFIAAGMAWRLFTGSAPENPSSATMIRYTLLLFLLGALMGLVPQTMRRF